MESPELCDICNEKKQRPKPGERVDERVKWLYYAKRKDRRHFLPIAKNLSKKVKQLYGEKTGPTLSPFRFLIKTNQDEPSTNDFRSASGHISPVAPSSRSDHKSIFHLHSGSFSRQ
jgi:hypothetical protein